MSRDQGLTLIELVVAMAIFALVAVMGIQALTGSMRMRDRLAQIDSQTAELGLALDLLRADLGAVVPMLFYPPEGGAPRSALFLSPDGHSLSLSLAGQPGLRAEASAGLQRAEWRVEDGALYRRIWPALYPAPGQAAAPWVQVLDGVKDWSVRSYWAEIGWVGGVESGKPISAPDVTGTDQDGALLGVANSYSSALPLAIEVTLTTESFGPITILESVK